MKPLRLVTTSWDDGDRSDLKLAELLGTRGIKGTFYIPITPFQARPALTHAEVRLLSSQGFEVGAHGFSHTLLWKLPAAELSREIVPCKPTLEGITGREVRMFCYPRGRYDTNVVEAVKAAGYHGARTVRMLATQSDFDPFEMPTTVQMFPHSKAGYLRNIARGSLNVQGLRVCISCASRLGNWFELSKSLFETVLRDGGVWHLYGHSWEIDELGLWHDLGQILDYIGNRKDVMYVSNSELLQFRTPSQFTAKGTLQN
jgi:peptidoglycan/xylan/chitin deacetylase (PgdA/CDA1 family)